MNFAVLLIKDYCSAFYSCCEIIAKNTHFIDDWLLRLLKRRLRWNFIYLNSTELFGSNLFLNEKGSNGFACIEALSNFRLLTTLLSIKY